MSSKLSKSVQMSRLANTFESNTPTSHSEVQGVVVEEKGLGVPQDADYSYEVTFRSYVDPTEANLHSIYYDPGRNKVRPTFQHSNARHRTNFDGDDVNVILEESESESELGSILPKTPTAKFGTWDGVFTSCLLNIFGVIMFLRVGWIVGQAGTMLTLVVIGVSSIVVLLTALSMSAICTNGEIRAGGAYYMISRSLGPSVGAAVGVIFSVGMSVAVALYVIGFMETFVEQANFTLTGTAINDARVYGILMAFVLLLIALVGVGWVIKVQLILLALLVASIISFFIGSFLSPKPEAGFVGYNTGASADNFGPDFSPLNGVSTSFVVTFSVFFPAVTGIMAGANISGDLKNPSESIPKGTLYAIGVSSVVYSLMAIVIGAVTVRGEPDGEIGLKNNFLIMTEVSAWGPLVFAGIYAATFSSALASLVGAPRILMSVAQDNLLPILAPFAKTRANGDPVRAYFVSFLLACACILIGELNIIAPLITMFFMMTYALINFACFQLSLAKSPGWRPQFRWYNKWTAFSGALLCVVMMFLLNYLYAIIATFIAAAIYKYIDYKQPNVNWGSAPEGRALLHAILSVQRLRTAQAHIKNFRPNYLVLTGDPNERMHLVHFVHNLRKGFGAVFLGNVVIGDFLKMASESKSAKKEEPDFKRDWQNQKRLLSHDEYFVKKSTTGKQDMVMFNHRIISKSLKDGCQSLIQTAGVGRLAPNTLIVGFKTDWAQKEEETNDYVDIIRSAFAHNLGVLIGRGLRTFDFDSKKPDPFGTVDIWWLLDDGGLSVLIPYIMSKAQFWKTQTEGDTVPLRLFIISDGGENSEDFRRVSELLRRFRLDEISIHCVSTDGIDASGASIAHYDHTIAPQGLKSQARPEVTKRWIRVSELMRQHSLKARLVYCTIPFPRERISAFEFMSWLELLSEDMPPMILIRGNGESVLTWYSE